MAAYNISDNTKEPLSEDHVKYILRRALDEVSIFKYYALSFERTFSLYASSKTLFYLFLNSLAYSCMNLVLG